MIDYIDHISILKFSRSTPASKYEVLRILFDDGDYVDIIIIMTAQSVCLCVPIKDVRKHRQNDLRHAIAVRYQQHRVVFCINALYVLSCNKGVKTNWMSH